MVGQSLGGLTAIAVAQARPDLVRRLVIVDVTPGVFAAAPDPAAEEVEDNQVRAFLAGPQVFASRDEIVDRAREFGIGRSRSSVERGVYHNTRQLEDGTWVFKHHLANGGAMFSTDFTGLWEPLGALRVPVLLVPRVPRVRVRRGGRRAAPAPAVGRGRDAGLGPQRAGGRAGGVGRGRRSVPPAHLYDRLMSEPPAASAPPPHPPARLLVQPARGMPDDLLPYRLWVSHGGLVRTAGLVAMDYTTGAPASHTDFVVQVRATMDNLHMVLGHAGTSLDQVLETRCYVHDMGRWDEMNAIYLERFGDHRPVRTTIETRLVPPYLFEISALAIAP